MTQLYSNLVKYSTTYLHLVLAVLWPLVACFTAYLTTSMNEWIHFVASHVISSHVELSKCSLFIIVVENKGGATHMVLKQRIYFA